MQESKVFSHGLESWVRRMQMVMGQANGTLHSIALRPVRPEAQMVRSPAACTKSIPFCWY